MQVTFTNASSSDVYVSAFNKTMAAGTSVTTSMSAARFDREKQLRMLIEAGTLTVAIAATELGDAVTPFGYSAGPAGFCHTTRFT